jgi:hypothetical protein
VHAGWDSSYETMYPLIDGEYWEAALPQPGLPTWKAAYTYRAALDARTTFTFAAIWSRVSQLGS